MRCLVVFTTLLFAGSLFPDEPVFSGPQPGEKLPPLKTVGVFFGEQGKESEFLAEAEGKPVVIVFLHKMTRPSVAVTRLISTYAGSRKKDGLRGVVVFLSDDATEAELALQRARHAFGDGLPIVLSPDGAEGPGSYGLNRNVTLTVLVGKENKATANFALIQPSVAADVPKVLAEIVKLIGGKVPSLEELGYGTDGAASPAAMKRKEAAKTDAVDPKLRPLLSPVISKEATPEDVAKAAKAVEEYVAGNEPARKQLGEIAHRIVSSGRLEQYGTPAAQKQIRLWAEKHGSKPDKPKPNEAQKPDKKT